jgi:hypothetical protein
MPFLALNGIVIPITLGQCRRGESKIGAESRSFLGEYRISSRGYRRTWEATALFQDYDIADGFIHLINGQGHTIKLGDGPTAATGLSPVPGYMGRGLRELGVTGGFTFTGTGGDFWSTKCLDFSAAIADFPDCFAWDAQLEQDEWTAIVVYQDTGVGDFMPLIFRSDGRVFLNGAEVSYNSGSTATLKYIPDTASQLGYFVCVRDGVLYLSISVIAAVTVKISDIVILPYVMCDYFVDQISTGPGAVSEIQVPSIPVTGEVTSIAYIQKPGEGIPNAKTIGFKLTEYLPGYKRESGSTPISPFDLPVLRLSGDVLSEGEGELTRIPVAP